jgi:hypothetical protein
LKNSIIEVFVNGFNSFSYTCSATAWAVGTHTIAYLMWAVGDWWGAKFQIIKQIITEKMASQ